MQGHQPEADHSAIFSFLAFNRTDQNEGTFFKGIKRLPHGHMARVSLAKPVFEPVAWYRLRDELKDPFTDADAYREMFKSSVGLRLRSDVPVGVCLSGGLDSTSIVSTLADDFGLQCVNTFSAVYGHGRKGDESAFIDRTQGALAQHALYRAG